MARGISAFEINARLMDKRSLAGGKYWAQPSEMLARAAECHAQGHAAALEELGGSEYAEVMQQMGRVAAEVPALFHATPAPTPHARRQIA